MRINKLSFQAIGPFAGRHDIDFDALGDSALFLIDGPTGAGKSTIIDAITYAIYNKVAGSESDVSRMRSLHANPETPSWVELTFTTQNGTYKVNRSPAYKRLAKRGGGLTDEKATVLFQELRPDGSWGATKFQFQESGKKLDEVVGLTLEQFVQTVILPQGEFAKFLVSDTKERQPLLERIFSTQLYARVAELLKEKSKAASKTRQDDTDAAKESLNKLKGAVGIDLETTQQADQLIESEENDSALIKLLENQAIAFEKDAQTQAREFAKVANIKKDLDNALAARKREREAQDRVQKQKESVQTIEHDFERAKAELSESYEVELRTVKLDVTKAAFKFTTAATTVASKCATLSPLVELEESLTEKVEEVNNLSSAVLTTKGKIQKLEPEVKTNLPKKIADKNKELTEAKAKATKTEALVLKKNAIDAEMETYQSISQEEDRLSGLEKTHVEASQAAAEALDKYSALAKSRLANMGAELATKLEAGHECMVCGSKEHPSPAKPVVGAATEDDVESARVTMESTRKVAEEAKRDVEISRAKIAELKKRAKRTLKEVEKDLRENAKALQAAEASNALVKTYETQLEELSADLAQKQEEFSQANADLAVDSTRLTAAKKAIVADKQKIEANLGDYQSLEEQLRFMEALLEGVNEIVEVESELKSAKDQLVQDEKDLALLEKHKDFANVEKAQLAVDEYFPTYNQAVAKDNAAAQRVDSIRDGIDDLKKLLQNRSINSAENKELIELSKWAETGGLIKQKLPTFVLQAMFEDVVAAANLRFGSVLEGRYEMRIPDEDTEIKGSKSLGLMVYERDMNALRLPTSLSGGEKFCAALCLALGLSDIVLSNNSGLSIDTFFIDEGFGSLDSDRLSQVMQMLDRLKADGRSIGLISHVDEMKAAITERIDVRPTKERGPSTLAVTWMN